MYYHYCYYNTYVLCNNIKVYNNNDMRYSRGWKEETPDFSETNMNISVIE